MRKFLFVFACVLPALAVACADEVSIRPTEDVSLVASSLHLRVARPTNNLDALEQFYQDALGMSVLYRFEDHDGFDGLMMGSRDAPYHFEFTVAHGHEAPTAPTKDHLLVFYLTETGDFDRLVSRLREHGHEPVASFNPYWDQYGMTFEDPDGYRIVLFDGPSPLEN